MPRKRAPAGKARPADWDWDPVTAIWEDMHKPITAIWEVEYPPGHWITITGDFGRVVEEAFLNRKADATHIAFFWPHKGILRSCKIDLTIMILSPIKLKSPSSPVKLPRVRRVILLAESPPNENEGRKRGKKRGR